MANEILNKVAAAEARRRGASCRVVSIGWGPWQGGMVSPALEKQFAARGVPLLPVAAGVGAFARELASTKDIEVVIGAGRVDLGDVAPHADRGRSRSSTSKPTRSSASHRVQGNVVLPAVLPVEWFARIASRALGMSSKTGLAVKDLRVLRGIVLSGYEKRGDRFCVVGELAPGGASVTLELRDEAGVKRYAATVERSPKAPRSDRREATRDPSAARGRRPSSTARRGSSTAPTSRPFEARRGPHRTRRRGSSARASSGGPATTG